ncbi:MAG: hypothetical protein K2N48_00120, partial [Muribaculaceae bacterium]|nr:hypothetical protein [Muribaculaceae bacterium]
LDLFDLSEYPKDMKLYLKNNGFHFNKKACKEAIKGLRRKNPTTGKAEPITDAKDKEEVEAILNKHNIKLECDCLYDAVWVYNMLASDFWKSAIEDEAHLAKAVKDVIDDPDQPDGFLFNRWISDRMFAGHPIEWSDLL